MRRYHAELEIIKSHHRTHLREVHGWPKKPVDCICDLQAGRFRKRKPLASCANPNCLVCRSNKVMQIPHKSELIARDRFKDSLSDV